MKKIFCALIAAATLFASTVPAFAAEVNTGPTTGIDGTKYATDGKVETRSECIKRLCKKLGVEY